MKHLSSVVLAVVLVGCVVDTGDEQLGETDSAVIGTNQLSASQLASSKAAASQIGGASLSSNSTAIRTLVSSADGRATMSTIAGCALPSSASVTATDLGGTQYTFQGSLNLAPAWQTSAPSTANKRWVTSCVLARTNMYGLSIPVSLRNDINPSLQATVGEKAQYPTAEAGFYGNLFQSAPELYACASQLFAPSGNVTLESIRACARSSNGATTQCGFSYRWLCGNNLSGHSAACTDKIAPYNACNGGALSFTEVVTTFSAP